MACVTLPHGQRLHQMGFRSDIGWVVREAKFCVAIHIPSVVLDDVAATAGRAP